MVDVLRLALGRLTAELLLGLILGGAFARSGSAGALVLLAAIAGFGAGLRSSRRKHRRIQRAAHLIAIGSALGLAALRLELSAMGDRPPSAAALAPVALLSSAAIVEVVRERAVRVKESVRIDPISVLAALGGAAMGAVLMPWPLARLRAVVAALSVFAAGIVLSASFLGGPGRSVTKPVDALLFLGSSATAIALLPA